MPDNIADQMGAARISEQNHRAADITYTLCDVCDSEDAMPFGDEAFCEEHQPIKGEVYIETQVNIDKTHEEHEETFMEKLEDNPVEWAEVWHCHTCNISYNKVDSFIVD
jgi:hypothetical protein